MYGTGPGCLLLLDPREGAPVPVRVLATHPGFVTPLKVRVVPRP